MNMQISLKQSSLYYYLIWVTQFLTKNTEEKKMILDDSHRIFLEKPEEKILIKNLKYHANL